MRRVVAGQRLKEAAGPVRRGRDGAKQRLPHEARRIRGLDSAGRPAARGSGRKWGLRACRGAAVKADPLCALPGLGNKAAAASVG